MGLRFVGPAEVERRYSQAETRLINWLAQNFRSLGATAAALALVAIYAAMYTPARSPASYFQFDAVYAVRTVVTSVIIMLCFSLLSFVPAIFGNSLYLFAAVFIGGIGFWVDTSLFELSTSATAVILLASPVVVLMSYWLRGNKKVYSAAVLSVILGACYFLLNESPILFRHLWIAKLIFIWLSIMTFEPRSKLAFVPTHGFRGALWPEGSKTSTYAELPRLWWRGFLNIVLGFLFSVAAMRLHHADFYPPHVVSNYIQFILVDVALFNFITGCARIYGFNVRDATRFLCLARTPADTWRRGSVYNYSYILRHVFFPVVKYVRFPFLATLAGFTFFTFTHWAGAVAVTAENGFAVARLVHVISYLALVYLTSRWWIIPFAQLERSPALAWLSVLLTHLIYFVLVYAIYVRWLGVLQL